MMLNTSVTTPNGSGLVIGKMYESGQLYVMVRHPKPVEKPMGGIAATKTSKELWLYTPEEVQHERPTK